MAKSSEFDQFIPRSFKYPEEDYKGETIDETPISSRKAFLSPLSLPTDNGTKKEESTEKEEPTKKADFFSKRTFLRFAASSISAITTLISLHNSYYWFASSNTGTILSAGYAIAMVACITLGPQFVIMLWNKKKASAIIASVLIAAIIAPSAIFSMSQTVGALYNQKRVYMESESKKEIAKDSALFDKESLERSISIQQIEAARFREVEKTYQDKLLLVPEDEIGLWRERELLKRRDQAAASAKMSEEKISDATGKLKALSSSGDLFNRSDFFSWASSLLSVKRDSVEFAYSAFPALFIDLVSPVFLAVALFI
jgi:hypothetical protein